MAQRYLLALDCADVRARQVLLKHMKNRALGQLEARHRYVPLQPAISFRTVNVDVGAARAFHPRLASDIIDQQHTLIHELANKKRKAASAPLGGRPVRQSEPEYKLKKLYHVQFGRERSASRQSSRTSVRARPKSSAAPSRATPATPGGRETRSAATTPREEYLQHQRELMEISREHKLCKRKIAQRLRDHFNQRKVAVSQGIYIRGKSTPGRADMESWLVFAGAQDKEADGVVGAFTMMEDAEEFYNIDGGVGSSVAEKLKRGDKIRIGVNGVVQSHSVKVPRPEWTPESAEQEEEKKEKLDDSGDIDALERKLNELMQEEEEQEAGRRRPVTLQPLSWEDQLNEANVKIVTPRRASPVRETTSQFESQPVVFEKVVRDIPTYPKLPSEHFQGYRVNTRNFNPKKPPGWGDGQKVNVVTVDNTSQQMMEDLSVLSVDEVIRSALLASQLSRSPSPEAAAEAPRSESSASGKRKPGSAYSERVPSSATPEPGFMAARLVRPSAPSISQSRPADLSITAPGTVLGKTHLDAAKRKNVLPPKSPMSPRVPPKIAYTSGTPTPYQGSEYIKIATQINPGQDSRQGTPNLNNHNHSASASFDERNVKLMSDRDYISQLMREQAEESEAVDFGGKPSSPASLRSESPPAMIGLPAHSPTPLAAPSLSPPWEAPLSPPPPMLRVNIPTAAEEQSDCQHVDGGEELTGPQRREKNLRDAHIEDITSLLAGAIPPGSRLAH